MDLATLLWFTTQGIYLSTNPPAGRFQAGEGGQFWIDRTAVDDSLRRNPAEAPRTSCMTCVNPFVGLRNQTKCKQCMPHHATYSQKDVTWVLGLSLNGTSIAFLGVASGTGKIYYPKRISQGEYHPKQNQAQHAFPTNIVTGDSRPPPSNNAPQHWQPHHP